MRRILLFTLLLISVALPAAAQDRNTAYSFILSAGGGVTKNISVFGPYNGALNQMGFSGTIRLMWKPEYLLRAGLETGMTHLYTVSANNIATSSGTGDAEAVMTAVPFQIMLSMPLWEGFELYGGTGIYLVNSQLKGFGTHLEQSVVSMGNIFALSYSRPVSEDIRLGTEVKWLYMEKFQDNNITLHFMFYYTLSSY